MVYIPTASDPTTMFNELITLAKVLGSASGTAKATLHVVSTGAQSVGDESREWWVSSQQWTSALWAALRTLRIELRNVSCKCIDMPTALSDGLAASLQRVVRATTAPAAVRVPDPRL